MTRLTVAKDEHGNPLVVTLGDECLTFRPKGKRTSFVLHIEWAYQKAVEMHVAAQKPHRVQRTFTRGAI